MTYSVKHLREEAENWDKKSIDLLAELVKIPTVAPRDHRRITECVELLEKELGQRGYETARYDKTGEPVVYAYKDVGAPKTLLFYHHYDVQPEGELDKWTSSPWELAARGNRLYGRGTSDDKGPLVCSIFGIDMIEKMLGTLPVNVKFVIEGEEESGSLNLPLFAKDHRDFLKADGCVWEGVGAMEGSPGEVLCGLRGDAYFELRAAGPPNFPRTDAHSGEAGGIPNPAWRLVWALSTLKDENEEIKIDGLNELVRPPSQEDLDALSENKADEASRIMKEYDLARPLLGRSSTELLEQHHLRPQLTICQLQSGQLGESDITIVPSSATAKLDVRLVPDLRVDTVEELLRKHLLSRGFSDIEVIAKPGYDPAKTPLSDPFVKLMRSIVQEACAPAPAVLVPMAGGSGPAYLFAEHSPLCMCYTIADLEGVNTHAPDENIRADSLGPSIALVAAIAERLGSSP